MANQRREPVSYRPFRAQPLLAEGLLAVERPGGELLERTANVMFRMADRFGATADRQAAAAGERSGRQLAQANRAEVTIEGGRTTPGGAGPGRQLTGDQAQKAAQAKAYLMQKHGLSDVAASGIVGNLAQESRFNTQAINPGDGADGSASIGVAQWNGKRARALRQYAKSTGRPLGDIEMQLDFLMHELGTTEKRAGNQLRAARTVDDATAAFIGFERPSGWTPQNPQGGHGWANRLAAARGVAGVSAGPNDGVQPPATPVTISRTGGGAAPAFRDTIFGRAQQEAYAKTYLQTIDADMRKLTGEMFDKYRDDPVMLAQGFSDLKRELGQEVFEDIAPDFDAAWGAMTQRYLGQARENLARKAEAQDRADFIDRTTALETDQQRRLADFDPGSDAAADTIAASQRAIDDHYDSAVTKGIMDPDDAVKAKQISRRQAALAFYGKQADALDAEGVAAMREEMAKDFADGGIDGLDGDGWSTLDTALRKLEQSKRLASERAAKDFRTRGGALAQRLGDGFDIDQAELSKFLLDAGRTPGGKEAVDETMKKIAVGRAIRDMSLPEATRHVAELRKAAGKTPSEAEYRQVMFAETMLAAKRKAIDEDAVSYAEAQGIVPPTPRLGDVAGDPGQLAAAMSQRAEAAAEAARQLGVSPRFLKKGEAADMAKLIRDDPAKGAQLAGAIVAGSGPAAVDVLKEFGKDAPLIEEAGAIIAFDGSARAAEDVILGYGKGADGKALKGLKPAAARESFLSTVGPALTFAGDDATRIERAAASIARKRISEEGLDVDSTEALAIHRQAVQEAAGAVFDRGVQFGGFAPARDGIFSSGTMVLIPNSIRADMFDDLLDAMTDDDLAALAVKPKAGASFFGSIFGQRQAQGLAETLAGGTPVAVRGGYVFAYGDPAGDDPQFVQGSDGKPFVLDIAAMRDRLSPRVPGAFR